MSSSSGWNGGVSFLLCTGASRGLGKAFVEAISAFLQPESTIYLTARSLRGLNETKDKILMKTSTAIHVKCFSLNLCSAGEEDFVEMFKDLRKGFDSAIVIHNAGDVGGQGDVKGYSNKDEMMNYLSFNYASVAVLNSIFMDAFKGKTTKRKTIVNVSSLCGIQPTPGWGNYCAVKAARDMLFKVLAEEEKDLDETVKVLNYAPGPVDTDLVRGFMSDPKTRPSTRNAFEKLYAENAILQTDQSAAKLVKILNRDEFKSGDHVDFYDVE